MQKITMQKTMIAIKIKELTPNGLVEIFELETEEISDDKQIGEALDGLTQEIYKNKDLFITTNQGSIIIRGIDTKTIKLEPVFNYNI